MGDNSYGKATRGINYMLLEPCVEICRNLATEDSPLYRRAEFEIITQRNKINHMTVFGRFAPKVHKFLVARVTEFGAVTPNICGPSVWNLLAVTVLASTILG